MVSVPDSLQKILYFWPPVPRRQAVMSTLTVHCVWEEDEKGGRPLAPSYAVMGFLGESFQLFAQGLSRVPKTKMKLVEFSMS